MGEAGTSSVPEALVSPLDGLPAPRSVIDAGARIRASLAARRTKVAVIDDDPTGTQTVRDVPVLTTWEDNDLEWALDQPGHLFAILTNSRSLPEREAREINARLGERLARLADARRVDLRCLSRSDSTLRGHFPGEPRALAGGLARAGRAADGVLVCPAFPDAGRVTIGDVHYVRDGGRLIPAGETEFARDPAFGYRHSNLREWARERGVDVTVVRSLSLEDVREGGPDRVAARLRDVRHGEVVIANVAEHADLEVLVLGLLGAEDAGTHLIYRTGPSFVGVRGGQERPDPLTDDELAAPAGVGLVVVGSHTALTTRQLQAARARHDLRVVELHVPELVGRGASLEIARAASELTADLRRGDAALVTSREVASASGAAGSLSVGRAVADALVEVVVRLGSSLPLAWVVAKGGITSSEVATRALGARRARVVGQLFPGLVSVWGLGDESRRPGLPYVVFPGNVGDEHALAHTLDRLKAVA
jgi:uncharacterized protein YgbK (DUF1537 family)